MSKTRSAGISAIEKASGFVRVHTEWRRMTKASKKLNRVPRQAIGLCRPRSATAGVQHFRLIHQRPVC